MTDPSRIIILISADAEWQVIHRHYPAAQVQLSLFGEWFVQELTDQCVETNSKNTVTFFQGGWGKIAAAASTQYVIDRWKPDLLINLGTCGGFAGEIERGTILLAEKTIVYDILEQMGDFDAHIAHYTTQIDLSWLKSPNLINVHRSLLVSGDRDLLVEDIPLLKARYGAIAGDWESGAIAFVAARNQTRLLILRGVTDLVGFQGESIQTSEAYGNLAFFEAATEDIMKHLIDNLPTWINQACA